MADWKLYLNGYAVVYDKVTGEIFQWNLTAQTIDQFNRAQQGYNPDIFMPGQLEELNSIRQKIFDIFSQMPDSMDTSSLSLTRSSLERSYEELEHLRASMRRAFLGYHERHKSTPEARRGYTEESPPLLTVFDQFALPEFDDGSVKRRAFKVRTHIEPLFFRAANRAAGRAERARAKIIAGEDFSTNLAEEIEAAAESIILSAICLEAYINGMGQDHFTPSWVSMERMEIRKKWLEVSKLLGHPDCFIRVIGRIRTLIHS